MTDYHARYQALAHAIQTGVATTHQLDEVDVIKGTMTKTQPETSPKMLRTGVNMALIEEGALAHLLIGKGIITAEELAAALIIKLEAEVESYETKLGERLGRPVKLV
jgi:hypothetical protein